MIKLTSESFDNITSNGTILVVFGADWCGDCRVVKPITEELASKYESIITVAELNIDDEVEIARRYDIKSIPTFILFKDGRILSRNDNVRQVETLENMIENAQIVSKIGHELMLKDFYAVLNQRRSFYEISPESKVSDERIAQMIKDAILCSPSAFNSQSAKVILLLGEQHKKLWNITKEVLKEAVDPENWQQTENKLASFANGYGTILYFEDTSIVENLQQKFPLYSNNFPVWAQQSNGILQYMIWTSLQAEGFGASLQHYNPLIDHSVKEAWIIPDKWVLTAQMPFGVPTKYPDVKDKLPINERFVMYV